MTITAVPDPGETKPYAPVQHGARERHDTVRDSQGVAIRTTAAFGQLVMTIGDDPQRDAALMDPRQALALARTLLAALALLLETQPKEAA
jgi:hypothetical protein